MLRLTVSILDSWMCFAHPREEYMEIDLDEFMARLLKRQPETPEMRAGSAIHEVLERAAVGDEIGSITANGVVFHFDGDFVVTAKPEREGAIIEKVYPTMVGPVLLRGRTDARTDEVTDYKLTFSTFDAERYAESLQWKSYLDMTGRKRFRYEVFTAKWDGPEVIVRDQHSLTLWAYPEMGGEVQRAVDELSEFIVTHVPQMLIAA